MKVYKSIMKFPVATSLFLKILKGTKPDRIVQIQVVTPPTGSNSVPMCTIPSIWGYVILKPLAWSQPDFFQ